MFRGHVQNATRSASVPDPGVLAPFLAGHFGVLSARLLPLFPVLHGSEYLFGNRQQWPKQVFFPSPSLQCFVVLYNSFFRLKKGSAQHLDMFAVAVLNMFLSIVGLPWMHGALPHSPLHLRALADVEERVAQGHVHEV